eukprot:6211194-Pleurochrysis_carterae.AAC.3
MPPDASALAGAQASGRICSRLSSRSEHADCIVAADSESALKMPDHSIAFCFRSSAARSDARSPVCHRRASARQMQPQQCTGQRPSSWP